MFPSRKADMISHFLLITLLILKCDCDPRTPRVYNVLITSKKNLAPSQALPVYEPVLRTTSIGLAFPPFIYTDLSSADQPRYIPEAPIPDRNIIMQPNQTPQPLPIQNQQSYSQPTKDIRNLPSNVVSLEQFVPLYTPHFTYQQYLPREEQKFEQPQHNNDYERTYNEEKKEQIVANFKKNPDIPDVPPPPLPVRNN